MALPDNGLFGAIADKKSLPTIEVAGPVGRSAEVFASDEMICFAETWSHD
jgi:hypothetical protein